MMTRNTKFADVTSASGKHLTDKEFDVCHAIDSSEYGEYLTVKS